MAISLTSISRTSRNSLPPRVVIHGDGGVGKSTFAASAYKSIFLPFEDGLSGLEVDAFPRLTGYQDAIDAIASLAQGEHEFGTVVVDSLDWLEPLVWAEVAKAHGKDSIEAIPYGKGYVEALPLWAKLLDGLNYLREKRGMAVILIAHSEIKRFEAPDSEPFDRYQIKLHKGANALVREWADIIGWAHHETAIKKENMGFQTRARGVATGRRLLRVAETPACVAKNRYSLPGVIPLEWGALMQAMQPQQQAA
ncbi:oxidoreductase [Pseudoxanthomonas kalamensis DSM 18571]|uniref:ATP-binding protein n=1 Tax=Pseudoxanthomonas kalamensis TaxID=289483 RepID=UPI0013920626|nr:ATP-binding protein [Pseudoxanthomonas kalamensis]KAF1711088.1 oxidoreductase [Pseudoxanthomonas kalamensis DSM 18571]